jgi:hypothetical protein
VEASDLFAEAKARSADPADPLAVVTAATLLGQEIIREADRLVDLAVHEAREAGQSWTAIGERLGMSKQAARRRFMQPFATRRIRRDQACSFCRKPPSPRLRMVHGEAGRICAECVALAGEIVAREPRVR